MFQAVKLKMNNKIRSTRGESISETLVSLLVASLALVMLAGSISAASHMVLNTRDKLKKYYAANEVVVNMDSSMSAESASIGTKAMTIKQGNKTIKTVNVTTFKNDAFENKPVTSYRVSNP